MRLLIVRFGLAFGVIRAAADDGGKQAVRDFGIGQGLGRCVAAGCQVFCGFVICDSFAFRPSRHGPRRGMAVGSSDAAPRNDCGAL
jgi:hypothetical protein